MNSPRPLMALTLLACASLLPGLAAAARPAKKILIYSGSTGFRHDSIPAADAAIKAIGKKLGFAVDVSEDPQVLTKDNLAQYKAIVFVSNTTDPKKPESEWFVGDRRDALVGFLKDGKGVVGVHAAADSHYNWGWYGERISIRSFGGGRVFYTGLGHTADSYQEPYLVNLLTGALSWAAGK